jgi:hypothetical protein
MKVIQTKSHVKGIAKLFTFSKGKLTKRHISLKIYTFLKKINLEHAHQLDQGVGDIHQILGGKYGVC